MLETERLWLRPWRLDDVPAFRRLATDSRVVRYINDGAPFTEDRIQEFIGRQIRQQRELGMSMWKLVLKASGETAGLCGLQPLGDTGGIEIGWWLAPEHWGQGLATEAARAALSYGFDVLKLARIVAVALPANRASVRIMEKIGMRHEGTMIHRGFEVVRCAATLSSPFSQSR